VEINLTTEIASIIMVSFYPIFRLINFRIGKKEIMIYVN